jgi:hypothetical protein
MIPTQGHSHLIDQIFPALSDGYSCQHGGEPHVFFHRQLGQKMIRLKNKTHRATPPLGPLASCLPANFFSLPKDFSSVGLFQSS